jgi:hypothetical protein
MNDWSPSGAHLTMHIGMWILNFLIKPEPDRLSNFQRSGNVASVMQVKEGGEIDAKESFKIFKAGEGEI